MTIAEAKFDPNLIAVYCLARELDANGIISTMRWIDRIGEMADWARQEMQPELAQYLAKTAYLLRTLEGNRTQLQDGNTSAQ